MESLPGRSPSAQACFMHLHTSPHGDETRVLTEKFILEGDLRATSFGGLFGDEATQASSDFVR